MSSKIKPLEFNGNWDLAPSIENTEHIQINEKYGLFINGKFIDPISEKYFPTINPSNESNLALIAEANKDIDLAVKSARDAYRVFGPKWQQRKG